MTSTRAVNSRQVLRALLTDALELVQSLLGDAVDLPAARLQLGHPRHRGPLVLLDPDRELLQVGVLRRSELLELGPGRRRRRLEHADLSKARGRGRLLERLGLGGARGRGRLRERAALRGAGLLQRAHLRGRDLLHLDDAGGDELVERAAHHELGGPLHRLDVECGRGLRHDARRLRCDLHRPVHEALQPLDVLGRGLPEARGERTRLLVERLRLGRARPHEVRHHAGGPYLGCAKALERLLHTCRLLRRRPFEVGAAVCRSPVELGDLSDEDLLERLLQLRRRALRAPATLVGDDGSERLALSRPDLLDLLGALLAGGAGALLQLGQAGVRRYLERLGVEHRRLLGRGDTLHELAQAGELLHAELFQVGARGCGRLHEAGPLRAHVGRDGLGLASHQREVGGDRLAGGLRRLVDRGDPAGDSLVQRGPGHRARTRRIRRERTRRPT